MREVTHMALVAMEISILAVCGVAMIAAFGAPSTAGGYGFSNQTQDIAFLNVSGEIMDRVNNTQATLAGGKLVEGTSGIAIAINTGWSAVSTTGALLTQLPTIYIGMISGMMDIFGLGGLGSTVGFILLGVLMIIATFTLLRLIFKVEL